MQQANYFFSYSRQDSDFVKRVATDLKKAGANVWLDQLDILPGSPWDDSIQNALNASQGLIVILSNESVKSKNVMDEVSYAMSQGKMIVPLMIESCPIPFRLARLQYIDFKGNYDSAFADLIQTLEKKSAADLPSSWSSTSASPNPLAKKSSLQPMLIGAFILVAALAGFALFKNKSNDSTPGKNADSTMAAGVNNKTKESNTPNSQPSNSGAVGEVPSQNNEQKAAVSADRINLLAPENGVQIIVASGDDWKNTVDGKEDLAWINDGIGKEAVYGFKDDRAATFDTFTMLVTETSDWNIKDFELFAGNDTPVGSFQSLGKFQTQNLKLFKTPYQEFKFPAATAKYLKVKLLSRFTPGYPAVHEFQLFGSLK